MNTAAPLESAYASAAQRSAIYRELAKAFTHQGAQTSVFGICGADYANAFDPSVSRQACSLWGRTHTEEDQGSLFEELTRFYEYFGLGRDKNAETPDHISVELEFMHFLTHLECKAAGRTDELLSVRRAQRDYLSRHLSRLIRGIHRDLKGGSAACVELVEAAMEFVNEELERIDGDARG